MRSNGAAVPLLTLTDTGPLVALIDEDDPYFAKAGAALALLPKRPLVTTSPCFTEAMYLLHRTGGYPGQDRLWQFYVDGLVRIHLAADLEWQRMREMMRAFQDTPMDLADASLVAAAETLSVRHIFTFDGHFRAYRTQDGRALEVIP